jgi:ankyrin repeat protein
MKTMNTKRLITEAAAAGDVAAVRDLLAADPVLVHTHSSDGWTPLHLAAHFGHLHVAEELLAHGADVDARASNHLATTPLLWGVMGQDVALVTLLLDRGADVNEASAAGSTSLHKAAVLGNAELTRLLLARGANVNARNSGGQTPLTHAIFKGHDEVVALLQQHGGSE